MDRKRPSDDVSTVSQEILGYLNFSSGAPDPRFLENVNKLFGWIEAGLSAGEPAWRALGDVLRAEEGSLYPALHRMEEAGWIRAEWITKDTGRRARMYELTAAGKKQLGAEEARWQKVTSAVNLVLRTV